MSRHGERIRKRADKRWEGRYKIGNKPNGKTMYRSVYGKSYNEVKEKLKVAEDKQDCFNSKFKNKLSFSFVAEQWLKTVDCSLKKSTVFKYGYILEKHIFPHFGELEVTKISAEEINCFLKEKMECGNLNSHAPLSKSYARTITVIFCAVMKYAETNGWCVPISQKIVKPQSAKYEIQVFSMVQQKQLEDYLLQHLSPTAFGILLALHAGLRIGEICALSWDDFDFQNNLIHIRATVSRVQNPNKNGTVLIIDKPKTDASVRAVPFTDSFRNIALKIKSQSASHYVISESSDFVSPRSFDYRYKKIISKLNLPIINFHSLRHTFATRCIEYAVDPKSLSEILGHANVSVTLNTYVHSSMELKRAQIEKLPSLSA